MPGRRRVVKQVDLNSISALSQRQKPDFVLLLEDGEVLVVEETGRPELKGLNRLEAFLRWARRGGWGHLLAFRPELVMCVVHYRKRDLAFARMAEHKARALAKLGGKLKLVSCEREFKERLGVLWAR